MYFEITLGVLALEEAIAIEEAFLLVDDWDGGSPL